MILLRIETTAPDPSGFAALHVSVALADLVSF
jgi:hypothetical protein